MNSHDDLTNNTNDLLSLRLPKLRVERRAMLWWAMRSAIIGGLILGAVVTGYVLYEPAQVWLVVPLIVIGLTLIVKVLVEPVWRYSVHRWEIGQFASYATSGWLVREWRVSPMSRIQTVDAVRGPLEQLLGLATLRITTASSYGAVKIVGLDYTVAQEAASRLAVVAEVAEGDAT